MDPLSLLWLLVNAVLPQVKDGAQEVGGFLVDIIKRNRALYNAKLPGLGEKVVDAYNVALATGDLGPLNECRALLHALAAAQPGAEPGADQDYQDRVRPSQPPRTEG